MPTSLALIMTSRGVIDDGVGDFRFGCGDLLDVGLQLYELTATRVVRVRAWRARRGLGERRSDGQQERPRHRRLSWNTS